MRKVRNPLCPVLFAGLWLSAALVARAEIPKSCTSLESLSWLLGEWIAETESGFFVESWASVSADTFEGTGHTYRQGERVTSESLRLVVMGEGIFYIAMPQQNARPVAFRWTNCDESTVMHRARFDNPDHDFPQRIEYEYVSAGLLRVHVSGAGQRGFTLELKASTGAF